MGATWDSYYRNFKVTPLGKFYASRNHSIIKKIFIQADIQGPVLDVGCGSGRDMLFLRGLDYDVIGIDNSPESIKLCEKRGFVKDKDVFLMDARHTTFRDGQFDLVFAYGVLEHFEDFSDLVKEMARLSRRYILLVQGDTYSLVGRILWALGELLARWNVREYRYRMSDFVSAFERHGFRLKTIVKTYYGFAVLLFEKVKAKKSSNWAI